MELNAMQPSADHYTIECNVDTETVTIRFWRAAGEKEAPVLIARAAGPEAQKARV